MDAGEIIYKAFAPTLKVMFTIAIGFALAKTSLFPPSAAKGVSVVALNVSIPALVWSAMVQSFDNSNISAFGGLALTAIMYQLIGAVFGLIIREVFYVPVDFQWGIIVMSVLSNWGHLPQAVVQTIGADAPFKDGDVDLGVAYIAVYILMFNLVLFPVGLHRLCALDFSEENRTRADILPLRQRWQARSAWFRSLVRPSKRDEEDEAGAAGCGGQGASMVETFDEKLEEGTPDAELGDRHGETDNEPAALNRGRSVTYKGGGAPLRKTSRSASFSSIRPIPPTAPLEAAGINEPCRPGCSTTSGSVHEHSPVGIKQRRLSQRPTQDRPTLLLPSPPPAPLLPVCSNHSRAYSFHEPASPPDSTAPKRPRDVWLGRLKEFGKALTMPVSLAILIAIPCALIPPVKALFTPVPGWTGGRMPNAPDGKPPLSFVLETAAFVGGIVVPAGLILLGAGFARLKGVMSLKGQPIAAMLAVTMCKMVVMPVIGVFFVRSHPSIFPPEDRMRTFVVVLLSGTPAAVNQLVITQLYNPEGTAHTLARFLLLQYLLMPVLSTALAAVAIYVSISR